MKIRYMGQPIIEKRGRRGSNQFQRKEKEYWKQWLAIYALFVLSLVFISQGFKYTQHKAFAQETKEIISPLPTQGTDISVPSITPTPTTTEKDLIRAEIKQVFGRYADKAFKLLECENKSLNPNAMNDNTKWDGVGHDWGIFQINDAWQGVSNKAFLTDYHINIRMAWNIFQRDNYSFKLWTCGR